MRYYEITDDSSTFSQSYHYDIDAIHTWLLPGVRCPACRQTWSTSGVEYPSISLAGLSIDSECRIAKAVAWEQFVVLRDLVSDAFPDLESIVPGTKFGQMVGDVKGSPAEFAWQLPWTVLAKVGTISALADAAINIPTTVRADLQLDAEEPDQYAEFELAPTVSLASSARKRAKKGPPCLTCGRKNLRKPDAIIINESTVPQACDMFRLRDIPTCVIVTERFKDIVESLELKGILFKPVEAVF